MLSILSQARDQHRAAALVVYGLPDRDCGNHSSGGLDGAQYPRWVDEIGAAIQKPAASSSAAQPAAPSQPSAPQNGGKKTYVLNKRTTTVATDNTLIGAAVEAVASGAGDTIGRVRLNATF